MLQFEVKDIGPIIITVTDFLNLNQNPVKNKTLVLHTLHSDANNYFDSGERWTKKFTLSISEKLIISYVTINELIHYSFQIDIRFMFLYDLM